VCLLLYYSLIMQFVAGDLIYSTQYLNDVEASSTEQSSDDEGNRLLLTFFSLKWVFIG
jgi:hypothetical protein